MDESSLKHDHFGRLPKSDPDVGVGMFASNDRGDVVQLSIRVRDGRIAEARFTAFGCGSASAAANRVATQAERKLCAEAARFDAQELAAELGLPASKSYCAAVAQAALREALLHYASKHPDAEPAAAATAAAEQAARERRRVPYFDGGRVGVLAAPEAVRTALESTPSEAARLYFDHLYRSDVWASGLEESRAHPLELGDEAAALFLSVVMGTGERVQPSLEWPIEESAEARSLLEEAILPAFVGVAATVMALRAGYADHRTNGPFEFGHLPRGTLRSLDVSRREAEAKRLGKENHPLFHLIVQNLAALLRDAQRASLRDLVLIPVWTACPEDIANPMAAARRLDVPADRQSPTALNMVRIPG